MGAVRARMPGKSHFEDAWLRDLPPEAWVPATFRGRPFNIFETGGTTGMPKQRIGWNDYRVDYEEFSDKLSDEHFPRGGAWLMMGPTGPRRLRLAIEHLAILDPALTVSQPLRVTAHSGIDAIAHAVETAVTVKRNPLSLMLAHRSFKLTVAGFPRVVADASDLEARGGMLLGAALAGLAIENSMLGAAHAAANPLTARHGIVHGEAVGIMLPAVVRFNAEMPKIKQAYAELAWAADLACARDGLDPAVAALLSHLETLLDRAHVARSLEELGVPRSDPGPLAEQAAAQWTATFNPRPVTASDFERLYGAAFQPRRSGG
jgi:hypothetical protein